MEAAIEQHSNFRRVLFWTVVLDNLKYVYSIKVLSAQTLFWISENWNLGCHLRCSVDPFFKPCLKWGEENFTLVKDEMHTYLCIYVQFIHLMKSVTQYIVHDCLLIKLLLATELEGIISVCITFVISYGNVFYYMLNILLWNSSLFLGVSKLLSQYERKTGARSSWKTV